MPTRLRRFGRWLSGRNWQHMKQVAWALACLGTLVFVYYARTMVNRVNGNTDSIDRARHAVEVNTDLIQSARDERNVWFTETRQIQCFDWSLDHPDIALDLCKDVVPPVTLPAPG